MTTDNEHIRLKERISALEKQVAMLVKDVGSWQLFVAEQTTMTKRENDKLKEQLIELRRVIAEQLGTRSLENPVDEWFPPSKGVKE